MISERHCSGALRASGISGCRAGGLACRGMTHLLVDCNPPGFRFAVKVPRTITHESKLAQAAPLLDAFLTEVSGLGTRQGVLLVQLPPSLRFDRPVASRFFADLRARHAGAVVCEPRHPTWFEPEAGNLLRAMRVARVAADPARSRRRHGPEAGTGWPTTGCTAHQRRIIPPATSHFWSDLPVNLRTRPRRERTYGASSTTRRPGLP